MDLDTYKNSWQQQAAPETQLDHNRETLLSKLADFDQKTRRENITVSILFAITTAILLANGILLKSVLGTTYFIGIGIICVLMLVTAIFFWRKNLPGREQDFSLSSRDFVSGAINRLRYGKRLTRIYMPAYFAVLMIGLIIGLSGPYYRLPVVAQFAVIGAFMIFLTAIIYWGMSRQYRKEREEINPMIEALSQIESEWK